MQDGQNITNEIPSDSNPNTEIAKVNKEQENQNTEINNIPQNQIQEVQVDNIPEISNENQINELGKDIQPQQEKQINNQENQQQAINQVQPQPQLQPQSPPEKKNNFFSSNV